MLNIEQTIEGLHKILDKKKKVAGQEEVFKKLFGVYNDFILKEISEEIIILESAILILTVLSTNTNGAGGGGKDDGRTEHNEI